MPPRPAIDPPDLPRQLTPATIRGGALRDEDAYQEVLLANGNVNDQTAHNVSFRQVQFKRFELRGTRLPSLHLADARFERCDLSGAIWEKAYLRRIEVIDCRLTGWQALDARIYDLLLKECTGQYVSFASGIFKGARFERCVLRDASFLDADLTGAVFLDCDLTNVDMEGAKLIGADLRGSTITGMRIGLREIQGVVVDLTQAARLLQGLGARVVLD